MTAISIEFLFLVVVIVIETLATVRVVVRS